MSKYILDSSEYNASLMPCFVLFGNKILALLMALIMSTKPDIVVTLDLVNVKYSNYFFSLRIVCVFALFARHKSLSLKVMSLFKI